MNAFEIALALGIALSVAAILHLCRHGLRHLPLHAFVLLLIGVASPAQAGWYWSGCCWKWYADPVVKVEQHTKIVPQTSTVTTTNHSLSIVNNFQYAQPAAAQGSTLYGQPSYDAIDVGALVTYRLRLAEQGLSGSDELLSQIAAGENEAKKIDATGRASALIANAVNGGPKPASSVTLQGQFNSGSGQQQTQTVGNERLVTYGADTLLATRCSRCHSPTGGTASADAIAALRTDTGLNDRDRIRAIRSLLTDDVAHRMPKGETLDAQAIGNLIQELSRQ